MMTMMITMSRVKTEEDMIDDDRDVCQDYDAKDNQFVWHSLERQ